MLYWLGYQLIEIYGPFRLLKSHLFLIGFGTALATGLTWFLLPKLWNRLPSDQGRLYAVGANQSLGKPVGAGIIFVPIFILTCLLVLPIDLRFLEILAVMLLVLIEGYLDDRKSGGLNESQLGIMDLGLALLGAIILCQFQPVQIWLPVIKADALIPAAQNALLKTLEEPPSASVFVLVSSMPDALLPTVRSRLPRLRFGPAPGILSCSFSWTAVAPDPRSRLDLHGTAEPPCRRHAPGATGGIASRSTCWGRCRARRAAGHRVRCPCAATSRTGAGRRCVS